MNNIAETVYDPTDAGQVARLVRQENLIQLELSIHRLTQHYTSRVMQRPSGGGRRETVIQHRPLISMLVTAATSKGGSSGTGSTAGGMVLNAVAFQKIADLKKHTRAAWLALIPGGGLLVDSFRYTPGDSLYLWHQTFDAPNNLRRIAPHALAAATTRWAGWVNLIELMFDPQPVAEFMAPCPGCKVEHLLTLDDEQVRSVAISYKTVLATCRNCGETWSGPGDFVRLNNGRVPTRHAAADIKVA